MGAEGSTQGLIPGTMIPLFRLPAANRPQQLGPWDYKQNKNLVLFFFHSPACLPCRHLLRDLSTGCSEYHELNTEVLGISQAGIEELRQLQHDLGLQFPLLSDTDGRVVDTYLGHLRSRLLDTAVFVADRYGALYSKTTAADADELPSEREIRDWLWFIEIQCPECFPPEWRL
jgi:peroxiredoxin